jgi:hypothetical protein
MPGQALTTARRFAPRVQCYFSKDSSNHEEAASPSCSRHRDSLRLRRCDSADYVRNASRKNEARVTQAIRNVQLLAPNAVPRKTRPCQAADFQAVFQLLRQLWPDKDLDIARVHQRKRAAGRADVHRLPVGTVGVAVAVGLGVTVEVGVGVTVGVAVAVAVAVGVGVGLGDARVLKVLSPP